MEAVVVAPSGDADVVVNGVVWSFGTMVIDEEVPSDCMLVVSKGASNSPKSIPSKVERSVADVVKVSQRLGKRADASSVAARLYIKATHPARDLQSSAQA
jgi:hypothetical protein